VLSLAAINARRVARVAVAAALMSAAAAAIHAAVAAPHFREYAPFGLLFAATAFAQAAWAMLMIAAPSARLLAAGAAGNAAIVGAWALSRTVGLPVGPGRWTPEPAAALDVAASTLELGVVAAAIALLAAGRPLAPPGSRELRYLAAAAGTAAVVAIGGAALAHGGGVGHHHPPGQADHGHVHGAPHAR
jgi:hypothetical protein